MSQHKESSLTRCFVAPRDDGDGPLFWSAPDGTVGYNLDRYAIVPLEHYEKYIKTAQRLAGIEQVAIVDGSPQGENGEAG